MPDSNPGPLPKKSDALPMSHNILRTADCTVHCTSNSLSTVLFMISLMFLRLSYMLKIWKRTRHLMSHWMRVKSLRMSQLKKISSCQMILQNCAVRSVVSALNLVAVWGFIWDGPIRCLNQNTGNYFLQPSTSKKCITGMIFSDFCTNVLSRSRRSRVLKWHPKSRMESQEIDRDIN